jgi:hypothetical protein
MKDKKDETSFVSIYIMLSRYKSVITSRWKKIAIIAIISGLAGVIHAWITPKVYVAEINFAIEDKSAAGGGMYSAIASQFGVDLGKGGEGAFKGDNILELYKSKSMVDRALLSSYSFNGSPQLLIDRYIEINEIKLDKKEFDYSKPITAFNRGEDSLLQLISNDFINNKLEWDKVDKKLAFIKYRFRSTDEMFAKVFLERLTQVICAVFLETKTKKIKANISMLEIRIDSVRNELSKEMSDAASVQDQNQNAAVARVRIPLQKKQMNIQLLTTLYGELVKNIELSKMSLVKEEPLIEIIDSPTLPLRIEKKSRLMTGIVYSISGAFVSIIFFILSTFYKDFKVTVQSERARNDGA